MRTTRRGRLYAATRAAGLAVLFIWLLVSRRPRTDHDHESDSSRGTEHLPRRAAIASTRFAATVAIVAGSLLVIEATLILTWKEPVTSFLASRSQAALEDELRSIEEVEHGTIRAPRAGSVDLPVGAARRARPGPGLRAKLKRRAHRAATETKIGNPLGRIKIPSIGASFAFVNGVDDSSLTKGPGRYTQTPLPGQRGTFALAGHRTTYLAPFRRIDELEPGDTIKIEMPYGEFSYEVEGAEIVNPDEVRVLGEPVGHPRIVLTACHPLYSAAQRIAVTGRLFAGPLGRRAPSAREAPHAG